MSLSPQVLINANLIQFLCHDFVHDSYVRFVDVQGPAVTCEETETRSLLYRQDGLRLWSGTSLRACYFWEGFDGKLLGGTYRKNSINMGILDGEGFGHGSIGLQDFSYWIFLAAFSGRLLGGYT